MKLLKFTAMIAFALAALMTQLAGQAAATDQDAQRAAAVAQAVEALELYGDANGTYVVSGGGGSGDGQGWYQYTDDTSYSVSIAQALINEGHLPTAYLTDPADTNTDHHLRVGNDFLVYRCKDRIAVFAQPDSASFGPSAEDQYWWSTNGCIDYPITTLGHTYFVVSKPLNSDLQRALAVRQAVIALESYGDNYGTYVIAGAGTADLQGWYQYTDNGYYSSSIAQVLIDDGHLPASYTTDPLDTNYDHHLRVGIDFLIYRCQDRIAVFAGTDGSITTDPDDAAWWSANGCIDYPLTTFGFDYFRVSEPLASPPKCLGHEVTVDLGLGQSPTQGNDVILGTPGDDVIDGLGGDDIICGRAGDDEIDAGAGDDIIFAGSGADTISAGPGADLAYEANYLDILVDTYDGGGSPPGTSDEIRPLPDDDSDPCHQYGPDGVCLVYSFPVNWTRLM